MNENGDRVPLGLTLLWDGGVIAWSLLGLAGTPLKGIGRPEVKALLW
jgi:hypothetical protein